MLEPVENHNNQENSNNKKKTILLVTNNIQHYQQNFNNYNIHNYNITLVNWNDILTFILHFDHDNNERKNIELVILDISMPVAVEYTKISQLYLTTTTTTTIKEIKKIFSDKRIFFLIPSQSMIEIFLSMEISKKEDIRTQPFSIFDIIDLISTTKKKERLYQIQLHDHTIQTYSSMDDKIKDAIKFLKIGIENNETTVLLLDKNIQESYLQSQMALHDINISKFRNDKLLNISYSEDWYLLFNQKKGSNKKNTVRIDSEQVNIKWNSLIEESINNGKKGLRVFSMMDCFFEYGLVDELIDYECILPPKLNKPFLAFCAYKDKHIAQLSEDQIRRLVLTHSSVWI